MVHFQPTHKVTTTKNSSKTTYQKNIIWIYCFLYIHDPPYILSMRDSNLGWGSLRTTHFISLRPAKNPNTTLTPVFIPIRKLPHDTAPRDHTVMCTGFFLWVGGCYTQQGTQKINITLMEKTQQIYIMRIGEKKEEKKDGL